MADDDGTTREALLRAAQLMDALLELRQHVTFNPFGGLTRPQYEQMIARVDRAIGGSVQTMSTAELQGLLNGPLAHPLPGFTISRLMLAIASMATVSPGAAEILRAHCRAREERDRFEAQH